MPEQKNVSPLLDGFTLGAPISNHNGVICCPAIKEDTSKKFIVKMITVPANQTQLDALLLAGAYKDPADAMEYFRRNSEDIVKEAELLKTLSKIEGFLPYDGWQMEPITRRRLGYEIFLVGSYKRSLEKYMKKNPITHLEAINLGLDLCAALSVCRQAGFIYITLKPSNIYVSENKDYRIGDLGFLNLDALRYASLPERCFSAYTPPELLDPMCPMNLTVDTYALGMILYQIYNDGHLPFKGMVPTLPLPAPIHADYELADIILKAIHPDPSERWTDPKDLGKAIASYMQRNVVNDIPITPFIPLDVEPEAICPVDDKETPADDLPVSETAEDDSLLIPSEPESAEETESVEETVMTEPIKDADDAEVSEADPVSEVSDSEPEEILASEPDNHEIPEDEAAQTAQITENSEKNAAADNVDDSNITVEQQITFSEDILRIIEKADDLIAHEIPEDTAFHTEAAEDPFAFALDNSDDLSDTIAEMDYEDEDVAQTSNDSRKNVKHFVDTSRRKKFLKFFGRLVFIVLLCAAAAGSYWYYQNIYLQTVDSLDVVSGQTTITVLIDTDVEESLLSVLCTDTNGKLKTQPLHGGKATFENLSASTQYTITVDMSGFHKLSGAVTEIVTTDATTQVLTFNGIAGPEDGSVVLDFTVDGEEPDFWNIRYWADGEDPQRETITNHSTTITGLTVGKMYTFELDGGKDFDLGGKTQLQYMAAKLILAEKITAISSNGNDVTVQWKSPGDVVIEEWYVRCYDGYGFEEKITVTETQAQFVGLNPENSYTVEITASGMTQPSGIKITSDPINISEFQTDESKKTKLHLTWDYAGTVPDGGWSLMYTVDGSGSQSVECKQADAYVEPLIPGAAYNFTVQAADGRTVYNNNYTYTTASAEPFTDNAMKPENLTINLLKTPSEDNWTCDNLQPDSFTDTFAVGDSASIAIRSSSTFYLPGYETKVLYVFRNSYGNVLTELVTEETYSWNNIWQTGDIRNGELIIPQLPSIPGEYVLQLYFNGKSVTELEFRITE